MLNKQFAEAIRPKILFICLRIKSVKQPLFLTVNSFKLKSSIYISGSSQTSELWELATKKWKAKASPVSENQSRQSSVFINTGAKS